MNRILSVAYRSDIRKVCYVVEERGREIFSDVFAMRGNDKESQIEALKKGLLKCKGIVKHEDLLVIQVGGTYLIKWLEEENPNPEYREILDEYFDILESIDCRYTYALCKDSQAVYHIKKHGLDKKQVEGASIADMFAEFPEEVG